MSSLDQFLAMGGHGVYVWPAFGLALAVLIGMAVQAWLQRRSLRRRLQELQEGRDRP